MYDKKLFSEREERSLLCRNVPAIKKPLPEIQEEVFVQLIDFSHLSRTMLLSGRI
jgi:hypothetical protein